MKKYIDLLMKLPSFEETSIENTTKAFIDEEKISLGRLIHPVRLAISASRATPGIFTVLSLVGKEETIERLKFFIDSAAVGK
jgi:glutamyl-tRNA synthetase